MRIIDFLITTILTLCYLTSFSQLADVKVETYYISNADDATDTIGGYLKEGSATFRIYIVLLAGSKIRAIYGDENHPLIFSSTAPFFNHREEGITFGKDFNRNRFEIGTAPLDTYITLGQCSKSFAQGAYFGVPKDIDLNGSIVGGLNNDGGSQGITSGLLTNDISLIGIPLTVADGLAITDDLPDSWIDIGFKDVLSNTDTTIFGLNSIKNRFSSSNVVLRNSGVTGVDPQHNEILIAQLTTEGEISFEINLEIEFLKEGVYQTVKYVARNENLSQHEIFNPLLSYPYACGCTDPDYLEASTSFACTDNSKCLTTIVLGCMDSLACNYNREANFNLHDICCYVGYCHDLDISVICPDLQPRVGIDQEQIKIYPNPAYAEFNIELEFVRQNEIPYIISDLLGMVVKEGVIVGNEKYIDIRELGIGYYTLRMVVGEKLFASPFIKM